MAQILKIRGQTIFSTVRATTSERHMPKDAACRFCCQITSLLPKDVDCFVLFSKPFEAQGCGLQDLDPRPKIKRRPEYSQYCNHFRCPRMRHIAVQPNFKRRPEYSQYCKNNHFRCPRMRHIAVQPNFKRRPEYSQYCKHNNHFGCPRMRHVAVQPNFKRGCGKLSIDVFKLFKSKAQSCG